MTRSDDARVSVVTGGARGIGRASAMKLAEQGRNVVIVDVDGSGSEVAEHIASLGRRATYISANVADRDEVERMVGRVMDEYGRLDILVNCAGVFGKEAPFDQQFDVDWQRVMAINFGGTLNCSRAAIPHMVRGGWGRVVTITSAARHGAPHAMPYGVSKAAVTSLMNGLAATYARDGVLVNCVEPGRALTDMVIPRFSPEYLANPPGVSLGRYSSPEEVAVVVGYLTSEENTYTVGAIWRVAGTPG